MPELKGKRRKGKYKTYKAKIIKCRMTCIQECLVRIRNLEGMEGLVKLLIHEFKNLNKQSMKLKRQGRRLIKNSKEVKKTGKKPIGWLRIYI